MDEAKAIINLKEGIIELQGPVEFVQRYLDVYQSAIKGLKDLPGDTAVSPLKSKALPRKRKVVRDDAKVEKRARGSCIKAIRDYLKTGFFDEPRSTREVKRRLNEAALTCSDNGARVSLNRLSATGLMNRVVKGRLVRYQRPVQP